MKLNVLTVTVLASWLSLTAPFSVTAATASDFTLLGIHLTDMKQTDIRKALAQWDGLNGVTIDNKHYDRFYPVTILRETYRIDIRYELDGSFSSLQLRYRPESTEYNNLRQGNALASIKQQLEPMIGAPNYRIRQYNPLVNSYHSYRWEDDRVSITLDYEGQQPGRPAMLQLRKKNTTLATNYTP